MLESYYTYRGHCITLPETANFGDIYKCTGILYIWKGIWEPVVEEKSIKTIHSSIKEITTIIAATCPHCGAPLSVSKQWLGYSTVAHCEYCNSDFILS